MKSSSAPDGSTADTRATTPVTAPITVWDLPVRLFHWALVLLLAVSWFTGREGGIDEMTWHLRAGYAVLALLLARIAWGFVGSQSARFSGFLSGPRAAWADARALVRRRAPPHAGHPPLGGWMVVAMLVLLLAQCMTGLFATDGIMVEGPLASRIASDSSEWLTTVHRWNADLLLILAGVHVAAVLWHRFALGSDLLGGMITGRRHLPEGTPAPRRRSAWLALALLLAAAALVRTLVT